MPIVRTRILNNLLGLDWGIPGPPGPPPGYAPAIHKMTLADANQHAKLQLDPSSRFCTGIR